MTLPSPAYTPKSIPYPLGVGPSAADGTIWGDPNSMAAIFPGIPAKPSVPPVLKKITIGSSRAKRYPGDDGYVMPAREVQRYNRVNPKLNGALPGRTFTASFGTLGTGLDEGARIFNFRLQGAWHDLVDMASKNESQTNNLILWSPSGHPTYVAAFSGLIAAQKKVDVKVG